MPCLQRRAPFCFLHHTPEAARTRNHRGPPHAPVPTKVAHILLESAGWGFRCIMAWVQTRQAAHRDHRGGPR
jgi:hypothetical protein